MIDVERVPGAASNGHADTLIPHDQPKGLCASPWTRDGTSGLGVTGEADQLERGGGASAVQQRRLGTEVSTKRLAISLVQLGGIRRNIPGSDGLPGSERKREQ
jgi:hypothetical protein